MPPDCALTVLSEPDQSCAISNRIMPVQNQASPMGQSCKQAWWPCTELTLHWCSPLCIATVHPLAAITPLLSRNDYHPDAHACECRSDLQQRIV